MKVVVIIPAAGLGTRMAPAPKPKAKSRRIQTVLRVGRNADPHSYAAQVRASPEITEIYIALRANEIAGFRARLEREAKDFSRKKIELVEGGAHRQQSVANAITAVSAAPNDIVLVHDAVRPS